MKSFLLVLIAVIFAGCASDAPTTVQTRAHYAAPDESAKLREQARASFERERERQGTAIAATSGPARTNAEAPRTRPPSVATIKSARGRWSVAEVRYASAIGKTPSELTAGERAAARSE